MSEKFESRGATLFTCHEQNGEANQCQIRRGTLLECLTEYRVNIDQKNATANGGHVRLASGPVTKIRLVHGVRIGQRSIDDKWKAQTGELSDCKWQDDRAREREQNTKERLRPTGECATELRKTQGRHSSRDDAHEPIINTEPSCREGRV